MPTLRRRCLTPIAALAATMAVAACYEAPPTAIETVAAPAAAPRHATISALLAHPGRTLAANCFQCHGTDGYAGELKIAGQSSGSIITHFDAFRARDPRDNIMNVHALAYTPEEITLIADYFAKQGG